MARKVAKNEIKVYVATHIQAIRKWFETLNKAQYNAKKAALTK
jgi:hypothetical protein